MRIRFALIVILAGAGILAGGCAGQPPRPTANDEPADILNLHEYEPTRRADNFLLMIDASSSMSRPYAVGTGFEVAGRLATTFNELVPEISWRSGVRVFGPVFETDGAVTNTVLLRNLEPHDRTDMARALARLPEPAGSTPLPAALEQAGRDLAGLPGRSVILLFTDGEVRSEEQVLTAASALEREFGGLLCIFPVFLGATAAEEKLLQQIVETVGGGQLVRGEDFFRAEVLAHKRVGYLRTVGFWQDLLLDRRQVANLVAATLLERCPPATDEGEELPPLLPLPGPVWEVVGKHMVIYFAFDRTEISPEDQKALDELGRLLQEDRDATILVEGHTDNFGSAAYNRHLSQRRATAVTRYLADNFGIEPRRIDSRGYGYKRPASDNDNAEGRRLNRRTEVTVTIITGRE